MINFFTNLKNRQLIASQDKLLNRFLHDQNFANKMAKHPLHACLGRWLPIGSNAKVLELGCGPGKYVALLSNLGFDVVGVDPYQFDTWEIIRKETSAQLLNNVFAENLPFADNSFDCVVCLGALLYFQNPDKALTEISRVIKPNGKIVLRTVNKDNLYTLKTGKNVDPASHNLYTMEELIDLVNKNSFKVVDSFAFGYYAPILPELWWYLLCVWLPISLQVMLSNSLDRKYRINNTVHAVKL